MDKPQLKEKVKVSSSGVAVAHVFMITLAVTVVALPGFFLAAAFKYSAVSNTNTTATTNTNTNNRVTQVCGNGRIELGEQCDDANRINCDRCSSICRTETAQELVACGFNFSAVAFKRGDGNLDGTVNITDAIYLMDNGELLRLAARNDSIGRAYAEVFGCLDALDADGNGAIEPETDSRAVLNYLFLGGSELPAPGPRVAGINPQLGGLGCRCVDGSCTHDTPGVVTRAAIKKSSGGSGGSDIPTCNDEVDNDNDGTCDYAGCTVDDIRYPEDPDCGGSLWTTEEPFLYPKRSLGGIDGTNGIENLYMTSVGDIDNNGKAELITIGRVDTPTFSSNDCLKAIDVSGKDLYESLGNNRYCGFDYFGPTMENIKPPILVDLDGIGGKEIIVFNPDYRHAPSSIILFDASSGNLKCQYSPTLSTGEPGVPPAETSPIVDYTVADMNGDGKQEIVVLTFRLGDNPVFPDETVANIDVIEPVSCTQIATYASKFVGGTGVGGWMGPRIYPAKLDSDNRIDIIASGLNLLVKYSIPSSITPANTIQEQILVLGKDPMDPSGNTLLNFPWGAEVTSIIAVADLNKDGKHEFIVRSGNWNSNNEEMWVMQYTNTTFTIIADPSNPSNLINSTPLYAMRTLWKGESGSIYPFAVADLENDGNLEVLAKGGMMDPNTIAVYRGNNPTANGNRVNPMRYIQMNSDTSDPMEPMFTMQNFIAADMDGDNLREIVAYGHGSDNNDAVKIFNNMGVKITKMPFWNGGWGSDMLISDLDGNGSQEIITLSSWSTIIWEVNTQFYQTQPKDPYPWGAIFHDIRSWNAANSCAVNSDCTAPLSCGRYSCVNYQCVRDYSSCPRGAMFIRGDVDKDGKYSLTDAINILGFMGQNNPPLTCLDAADVDNNGKLQITDAIRLLGFLFRGDPVTLPQPFRVLGYDPTPDTLPLCQ